MRHIHIRQPRAGDLLGVSIKDLLDIEMGAVIQVLPKITTPRIRRSEAEQAQLIAAHCEAVVGAVGQAVEREREVLQLLAEGNSSKDIASRLSLSVASTSAVAPHPCSMPIRQILFFFTSGFSSEGGGATSVLRFGLVFEVIFSERPELCNIRR